jgi:hypothetical protein
VKKIGPWVRNTVNFYHTVCYFKCLLYILKRVVTESTFLCSVCTDTWSHEMVPCPFFSRPGKKQLHACSVIRKKVTIMKGSCVRAEEIKNVAV